MEPEGSLSRSQEPSTGPYPKPDQPIPPHPITLRSILILSLVEVTIGARGSVGWLRHYATSRKVAGSSLD
jgi:hypothetical protein